MFYNVLPLSGVCKTSLFKTPREKEKLLVTSNFSLSKGVFHTFGKLSAIFIKYEVVVCKLFQSRRVQNLPFWKGLKYFCSFVPLVKFVICRGLSTWQTVKFVVWERVKQPKYSRKKKRAIKKDLDLLFIETVCLKLKNMTCPLHYGPCFTNHYWELYSHILQYFLYLNVT